jgi:DNA polymerase-3 subunit gamma/tau
LKEVLAAEGTESPEEALRTIARRAEGGMRDALSLLDQVLALTGGDVSQEAVRRVLGLVEAERYLQVLDILRARRHGEVFTLVEDLLEEGYDMVEFHRGLVDVFRLLLRVRLGQGEGGLGVREDLRGTFRERSEAFSPGDLVRMLAIATEVESTGSLGRSAHPRLLMEMLLLRLSYLDRTVELETLLQGLGGVDDVQGGSSTPSRPGPAEVNHERDPSGGADLASGRRGSQAAPPASLPEPSEEGISMRMAWTRALETPGNLPRGVLPFLRAARVDFPRAGAIQLSVLPGPGLEKLKDPAIIRKLREAVGHHAGSFPDLSVREEASAEVARSRVTEGSVRDGRLRELVEEEPTLGEAVEELDLELLD